MTPNLPTRLFLTHPRAVGESYLQHMAVAFGFAWLLGKLAVAAALHGLVPAWHEKTVSRAIIDLSEKMKARH